MKILFINAIDYSNNIETVYPPLGLAYMSSSLKKHFPDIQIKIIDRDIEGTIKSYCPDAVGVSTVSQNYGRAINIGNLCKSLKIPVFVGGIHITLLPESLSGAFDFGVNGEGEETIIDIVDFLVNGGISGSTEMDKINGLVVHSDNGPRLTPIRKQISNLDTVDMPDRSLLHIPKGQTTYLFTSRGCPYKCTFCASTRAWGNRVRWFSAEYVVNEIEQVIKEYNPWAISFYDDLFIANFKRLAEIVELICTKGIHKKVKFSFACRSNLVNARLIEVLKPLNVHMVCMGLESGCQRVLTYLKGPGISVEQHKQAVDLFVKAKINVQGTFVIGSPDETEDEIIQTLQFIKRSKLTNFEVYTLTPLPGTPIWDEAEKRGLVSNDMNWDELAVENQENRIILSELPKHRLLAFHNMFAREKRKRKFLYIAKTGLTNPLWVVRKLGLIRNA